MYVAREKGAVTQVRINSVRKRLVKFMAFFGRCTGHLVCFELYLCFSRADNVQQMENRLVRRSSKETRLYLLCPKKYSNIHRIQQWYSTVKYIYI